MTRPTPNNPTLRRTEIQPEGNTGVYALTIHIPDLQVQTITLEHGKQYTVGRDESADIVLAHPCVSGRHAIVTASEPPSILDLGSRNGTYAAGHRLAPQKSCSLRVGSVVRMGGVSLFVAQGEWRKSGVRRAKSFGRESNGARNSGASNVHPAVFGQAMQQLHDLAKQIAPSSSSVLITGETGVGKELMAQAIHSNSLRARRELVVLNGAAIPEGLVESELFGWERGAFSGAVGPKPGLFEVAHGSTFFLAGIGELPLSVQAKLLRVLETGEVSRLGAIRPTRVDVRIVAATNRHLPTEVARGAFRADLYYRLNGLTLWIPPLRERTDDIEPLARHFAERCTNGTGLEFSPEALEALLTHPWPGNVRELKSVVERAALIARGGVVAPSDLMLDDAPHSLPVSAPEPPGEVTAEIEGCDRFSHEELPTGAVRAEIERRELRRTKEALDRTAGNQTEAARLLGISRRTLMNRMDRLGIRRPRKGPGRSGVD